MTPNKDRQAKFLASQKKRGLVLVRVWVPKGRAFMVKNIATRLAKPWMQN